MIHVNMGVKLNSLVYEEELSSSILKGRIMAVDGPNIIISLLKFSMKDNENNKSKLHVNRLGKPILHFYGILYRVNFFLINKILPIFCFDGIDSELKRKIVKDSLNDFLKVKQLHEIAIQNKNLELARKIAFSKEFYWPSIIEDSKHLLKLLGIPIIQAPASAESQCAQLVKNKVADFANSQDYDALLFGCPKLIRNFTKTARKKINNKWIYKKITPSIIYLNKTLKNLKINYFQLVDLSILIGTDYFEGIKKIGPRIALNLIRTHKNLENVMEKTRDKYDFSKLTKQKINDIRKIFIFPHTINKISDLRWSLPKIDAILTFLCDKNFLDREKVDKVVKNLESNFIKCLEYFKNSKNKSMLIQTRLF